MMMGKYAGKTWAFIASIAKTGASRPVAARPFRKVLSQIPRMEIAQNLKLSRI
jgi:hypothetical protein